MEPLWSHFGPAVSNLLLAVNLKLLARVHLNRSFTNYYKGLRRPFEIRISIWTSLEISFKRKSELEMISSLGTCFQNSFSSIL